MQLTPMRNTVAARGTVRPVVVSAEIDAALASALLGVTVDNVATLDVEL
jgi:hypothetical protein